MADIKIHIVNEKGEPLEAIAIEADFFDEDEDRWVGSTRVYTNSQGDANFNNYDANWSFALSCGKENYGKFTYGYGDCITLKK